MKPRFDALSRRHRECLRLVYDRQVSKEIAVALGIEKSTVDTYITEAIRILDARDRRHAAQLLAEHEAGSPPDKIWSQPAGVEPAVAAMATVSAPGSANDWRSWLPYRRRGATHNTLGIPARLLWIVLLAIMMLIAFGMLVDGLAVLGTIVAGAGPAHR